jgi:hypothetical protein
VLNLLIFSRNLRNNENNTRLNFTEWKLLKPNHIVIDDQDKFDKTIDYKSYQTFGDPWKNDFHSFKNHLRALNSLYQVTNLLESVQNRQISLKNQNGQNPVKTSIFDVVVFLRPDVMYISELPIYLFNHFQSALFVPDFQRSCSGKEFNDRMAMG